MTPAILYAGARGMVRIAHEWQSSKNDFDDAWRRKCEAEAMRCRDLACHYMRSRKWLLNDEVHNGNP